MTGTTGLTDTFTRTVAAGGWGSADSGQAYTVRSTATDYAVSGGFGTITPSATSVYRVALADGVATQWNVATYGKVSALPGSGTLRIGLVGGGKDVSNFYTAYLSITSAGAVSINISRVVASAETIFYTGSTIAGLTIAAGTLYGFRFAGFWDFAAQTFNLFAKVWFGTTEPYGWNASGSDATLTDGSLVGVYAVNVSGAVGPVFSFDTLASSTHSLPVPVGTDPMCYDPTYPFPHRTVLQSVAEAVDAYAVATIDPAVAVTATTPRVRVSKSNYSQTSTVLNSVVFDTVEYNVGTDTDLGIDPTSISLGAGIWVVTWELTMAPYASANDGTFFAGNSVDFRTDAGTGGGLNGSAIGAAVQVCQVEASNSSFTEGAGVTVDGTAGVAFSYLALSAVRVADFF